MIQVAIEKYKKVQDLNWNETENNPEKESKLKAFHGTIKSKYFGLCVALWKTKTNVFWELGEIQIGLGILAKTNQRLKQAIKNHVE